MAKVHLNFLLASKANWSIVKGRLAWVDTFWILKRYSSSSQTNYIQIPTAHGTSGAYRTVPFWGILQASLYSSSISVNFISLKHRSSKNEAITAAWIYHVPQLKKKTMKECYSSTLKQGQGILPTEIRSMISCMHPPQYKVPLCLTIWGSNVRDGFSGDVCLFRRKNL